MNREPQVDAFDDEVLAALHELASLPSVLLIVFSDRQSVSRAVERTCRVYDDDGTWSIWVAGEVLRVRDFFLEMTVAVTVHDGMRVVQGRSSIGVVYELRPN